MIAAGDIIGGVYGAWRLARRDPAGMIWFDSSPSGVWHSFWGPVLVLPGFLVLQALDGAFDQDIALPLVVQLIAYVMGCVAFPLALANISDGLNRAHRYPRFIVAYNWSAVIQMALLLPTALLAHLFPGDATTLVHIGATIVLLVYQAYVAHVALEVPPATAGMLVLLDLMIGALIQMSADHLIG